MDICPIRGSHILRAISLEAAAALGALRILGLRAVARRGSSRIPTLHLLFDGCGQIKLLRRTQLIHLFGSSSGSSSSPLSNIGLSLVDFGGVLSNHQVQYAGFQQLCDQWLVSDKSILYLISGLKQITPYDTYLYPSHSIISQEAWVAGISDLVCFLDAAGCRGQSVIKTCFYSLPLWNMKTKLVLADKTASCRHSRT